MDIETVDADMTDGSGETPVLLCERRLCVILNEINPPVIGEFAQPGKLCRMPKKLTARMARVFGVIARSTADASRQK